MRRLPAIVVTLVLAVLAVAVVATAVLTGNTAPSSPAAAAPPEPAASGAPAAPAGPLSVAFLGDGYTSGSPSGGQGQANYTALLGSKDGWTVTKDAVYGSGYVAGPALDTRLQKIVASGPQLVVVTAGRADDESDPATVGPAATKLYQDLKATLPQAKVVVIGPMYLGDTVPAAVTAVRDSVRDAATQAQLPFIDPVAEKWFVGSDQDGIAANKLDLNDKGQQRLSQLVDEALTKSGALPS